MAKRYHIERTSGEVSYDLPAPMVREIGRIVVHWTYVEYFIQGMCWEVLRLAQAEGRIAVREPRCADRLEMLRDLVKLRKGSWDEDLYESVHQRASQLQAKRDPFVHGAWRKHADTWYVLLARGSWGKKLRELVEGPRRIEPQMAPVTTDSLRSVIIELADMIADLKRLKKSARVFVPSSPETPL